MAVEEKRSAIPEAGGKPVDSPITPSSDLDFDIGEAALEVSAYMKGDAPAAKPGNDAETPGSDTTIDGSAPKPDANASKPDAKAGDAKPGGEADAIEVPETLSAEEKALFARQPRDAQEFLARTYKGMVAEHTKKTMATSEKVREADRILEPFAPHREVMAANNIDPATMIRRWMTLEQGMNKTPEQTIQTIANAYGVDLHAMIQKQLSANTRVDPALVANRRIDQLEKRTQQEQRQAQERARLQGVEQTLVQFANEKGTDGAALRPYIVDGNPMADRVFSQMIAFAHQAKQNGQQPDLANMYEQAVWSIPEIRAELQAQQREAATAQQTEEGKAKALAAVRAGASGNAPGGDGKATIPRSLEGQVAHHFDQMGGLRG